MVPEMPSADDFFEEDESVEDVVRAYEHGVRGVTAPPIRSFWFTFVVPQVLPQGFQVGEWTSIDAPAATDSLTSVG